MGKHKVRLLTGAGAAFFMGMLLFAGNIPEIPLIYTIGIKITKNARLCPGMGQEGEKAAIELLGGQLFWGDPDTDGQKSVLEENRQASSEQSAEDEKIKESETLWNLQEENTQAENTDESREVFAVRHNSPSVEKLKSTLDTDYLWREFYIVDSTTSVTKNLFPVKTLLEKDLSLKKNGKKQILIYHTHGASEYFADSRKDCVEDSVVGIGDVLALELEKRGYGVVHDRTRYDRINGSLDRSLAYNKSLEGIEKNLKKNPEIDVVIDLHRDSVGKGKHTYTTIQGKKTAVVMFFNGMSRTRSGPIEYLKNQNLTGNLAFSLQLKCKAMEYYDGFTKPIYLKGYRYNLHLKERSLLIELGNENNTVEEAKNAAAPLAEILCKVLVGQE